MNDNFAIVIKEKGSQNCACLKLEKALTSISLNELISLNFGYQLSITNVVGENIHILVTNTSLNLSLTFVIINTSDILLDLPLDNGCYRVYIAITNLSVASFKVCPSAL